MREGRRADRRPGGLGSADLHIHTSAGDGVNSVREIMDYVECFTDLDVIAITDHDEIAGALEAIDLAASHSYSFEVVPGTEITTREGHLLALFVRTRFPMLKSLAEAVTAVREQGGICVVPHPMSWLTLSVGRRRLLRLGDRGDEALRFDAIETFNPTVAGRVAKHRVEKLNRTVLGLAETGGSDAHSASMVGTARTRFPGRTAADLRRAIAARTTSSEGVFWSAGDHLQDLAAQQWRALVLHPCRKLARAFKGGG